MDRHRFKSWLFVLFVLLFTAFLFALSLAIAVLSIRIGSYIKFWGLITLIITTIMLCASFLVARVNVNYLYTLPIASFLSVSPVFITELTQTSPFLGRFTISTVFFCSSTLPMLIISTIIVIAFIILINRNKKGM